MNPMKLLAVYFAAKSLTDKLKAGQQFSQDMFERLDRAVTDCKVEVEESD